MAHQNVIMHLIPDLIAKKINWHSKMR